MGHIVTLVALLRGRSGTYQPDSLGVSAIPKPRRVAEPTVSSGDGPGPEASAAGNCLSPVTKPLTSGCLGGERKSLLGKACFHEGRTS